MRILCNGFLVFHRGPNFGKLGKGIVRRNVVTSFKDDENAKCKTQRIIVFIQDSVPNSCSEAIKGVITRTLGFSTGVFLDLMYCYQ